MAEVQEGRGRMRRRDLSSLSRPRPFATLLSALALALLISSCAGNDGEEEAEQPRPEAPPAETEARPSGTAEEPRTATSAAPAPPKQSTGRFVWVGVEGADQVALVDIGRGKVLARRVTPGGPHNVTVAEDGTAAATLYGSDRLALVRGGKVRLLELGGRPHDVKAAGGLFAVANEAARRIDLVAGGRHAGSIRLEAEPHDLAVAPGGERAWVTLNGTDELALVDLRSRRLLRYVRTGQRPHDILYAPDGRLWVTDWAGPVHVFDRSGRLRRSIPLGRESHHLAFTPDGRQAWITDHGAKQIFVVDARRLKRIDSLPIRGAPHHVAITPDGTLAAVADHDDGTVAVYDVRRRTLVRTVRVGAGPHGVWAVPTDQLP